MPIRIALAQINPTVGDIPGNQKKISDNLEAALRHDADLVVFPELAICGYPPEDLLYKEHFVKENLKALKELIRETKGNKVTAVIGFVDRDAKGNLYNAAAIVHDGVLKGVSHKSDLPNYGVFDEKRYFLSDANSSLFSLNKQTFGVSICEDIWTDAGLAVQQAKNGAKLLINISSSPFHEGKNALRQKMLKIRARQTKCFVCYTNVVGGQDELVFDGGSMVYDPQGKLMACAKQFSEDLLVVDLDLAKVPARKSKGKVISLASPARTERAHLKPYATNFSEPLSQVYEALVLGTRDYVRKNGFHKVAIGLSGGIDSALVATIAVDAIGKDNVVGLSMPSQFSSKETQSDAKVLAQNLGIRFIEIPIKEIFEVYLKFLTPEFSDQPANVAEENLQARIRGNIMMAFSNKFGWLVLTTGNKSEIAVGYCTLYGDMSGGFAVIKDVPKTKVYELAKLRNQQDASHVIPQSILDRAPTAELRENQKDQDSLPPYEVLDPLIKSYVEEHLSFPELMKFNAKQGIISEEMVKDVIRMVDRSEYKRRQAPPGIKITARAFGKDWRLPITNGFKEF